MLENILDEPGNGIGTTKKEMGHGNVLAGLTRGPLDDKKKLMLKIFYGLEEK
jgi:hypothetical protein